MHTSCSSSELPSPDGTMPNALNILLISSFSQTRCFIAFSTFRILPRNGIIAWKVRSLPCLAVPPAESPSTKKISVFSRSRDEQSANLPGRPEPERTVLRCTISRALRAAWRAVAAKTTLLTMARASLGFSSR